MRSIDRPGPFIIVDSSTNEVIKVRQECGLRKEGAPVSDGIGKYTISRTLRLGSWRALPARWICVPFFFADTGLKDVKNQASDGFAELTRSNGKAQTQMSSRGITFTQPRASPSSGAAGRPAKRIDHLTEGTRANGGAMCAAGGCVGTCAR